MQSARIKSAGLAVQRIRRARWTAWCVLAASTALLAAAPAALGLLMYAVLGSLLVLLNLYFGSPKPPPLRKTHPGDVTLAPDAILLETHLRAPERIPRADLAEGWIDSFRDQHRVVLRKKTGDVVWISVTSRDEGRTILRAAGLSVEQHLYSARLVSNASETLTHRTRALFWVLGIYFLLPIGFVPLTVLLFGRAADASMIGLLAALLVPLLYLGAKAFLPRTAKVGADGVTLTGFRSKSFIPFADVSRAWANERGVWLERTSGEPVLLATMARMAKLPQIHNALPAADTLVLLDRVNEAMAMGDPTLASAARFGHLDRKGRPIEAWQRDLRALLERESHGQGYRSASLGADDLARLVETTVAAPERRIAAAIALSSTQDPALKTRLRFAVSSCANEDLRAALEQAAEGEIDEARVERATRSQP